MQFGIINQNENRYYRKIRWIPENSQLTQNKIKHRVGISNSEHHANWVHLVTKSSLITKPQFDSYVSFFQYRKCITNKEDFIKKEKQLPLYSNFFTPTIGQTVYALRSGGKAIYNVGIVDSIVFNKFIIKFSIENVISLESKYNYELEPYIPYEGIHYKNGKTFIPETLTFTNDYISHQKPILFNRQILNQVYYSNKRVY